jgi:signal transduction histidine kinase
MRISDYGEISISGVRERLLRVPRDERVPTAIERFNSILSVAYEELLMDPDADVEGILEKLRLVLTLNKDRAIALGVYPTLLGTLATKIPRTQTHRLYSAFLEELVDERTRELEEAQDNLLKSQRLAVIGEAAAMVGHDLRNPLQAIVNTLYLAQKKIGSSSNKELRELLDTISEQVEYMNKIVSDLQDYSRTVKPKLVETDLHGLLNETLSAVRVPENVKLSVEIEGDMNFPKLMVDAQLMKRVFINLITNAIQAMPQGGQIRVKASEAGGTVSISLHDTGVGISEENLSRMFQPLFTTKAKGQGLGLAVCKRLVEAHEGRITVESAEGRGATFTIEIPSKSERHPEKAMPHLPQAA